MKQRVISAVVALIIVIPLIILGGIPYYIGLGVLSIIGYYEIITVYEHEKKLPLPVKIVTLITYLCMIISSINSPEFSVDYRLIILDIFACTLPLIVYEKDKFNCNDALFLLAITLFLGISFNFTIVIRNISLNYLLYVLLVTTMSDTFAHFFGTMIGKKKLCPKISPNKTVEGLIGGVAFGTFIGSVFFLTFIDPASNILLVAVVTLILSLVAEFGDLVFSAIKRKYGVKDYGNIMPGHGGVLDRLDSLIYAILAFSYLVYFF